MTTTATPAEVLEFWFGPASQRAGMRPRDAWFRKDPAFDQAIRERFGPTIEAALQGALPGWDDTPEDTLAQILLLDQFTRNAWRDTPRAFAGDARALALARRLGDRGDDLRLAPMLRWFVYMPFEHAEDLAVQDESVRLFTALAQAAPGFEGPLDYALRHRDVIRRFGRFPHRNAILGRDSSPEERAYLSQPGAGF
jgi:uncharacterized protein (DUF924 family)